MEPHKSLLPESDLARRLFRPPLRAIMMPAMERKRNGEDVVLLAGGCPHPSCSPIDNLSVRLRRVGMGAMSAAECGGASEPSFAASAAVAPPADAHAHTAVADGAVRPRRAAAASGVYEGVVSGELRDIAMNYHAGAGVEELRTVVEALQRRLHAPPRSAQVSDPPGAPSSPSFEVTLTSGNSDALLKAIELLTNPGDVVLAEAFAWPTTLAMCLTRGRRVVGIPLDSEGMDVAALRAAAEKHRGRAKVLAVTPSGHNPTGISYTDARRREVYAACRDAGLAILEDDPYFLLHMPLRARGQAGGQAGVQKADEPCSLSEMRGLVPCGVGGQPFTFLALDADPSLCGGAAPGGRVVRLDSFSKILAPGLRLGWLSAPANFVGKFRLLTEASNQHPSGVSQAVVREMLRAWGDAGLDAHLRALQLEYTRRRDVLLSALEAVFAPAADAAAGTEKTPLATWEVPECGMLVWLRQYVWADTLELGQRLVADGVACVPGALFSAPIDDADEDVGDAVVTREPGSASSGRAPCPYLRLTFASASDNEMVKGCERIAAVLRRDAAELAMS